MPRHVLVVDDEPQIRRALTLNLSVRGYEVDQAGSSEEALQRIASERPDLVLLDLGLPGRDGIAMLEILRRWSSIPVIVITARDDDTARVQALDTGADDYVLKPFGMAELLSRVAATLRRIPTAVTVSPTLSTANFDIDLNSHTATAGDLRAEVVLTPTEWSVVGYLIRHAQRLVTHQELTRAVWGSEPRNGSSLIRGHIHSIRRKLERDPAAPEHFVNDHGSGYRLVVAPVPRDPG